MCLFSYKFLVWNDFLRLGSLAIYVSITCLIFNIINLYSELNLNKQFFMQ